VQGFIVRAPEAVRAVSGERTTLDKIEAGDQAAFTTLYDRYAPLVYGIARRILDDPVQAEDVTQSVFTLLWTRPHVFSGGSFGAWISRVARNAALDVVRSAAVRTREPEMPEDLVADDDLEEEVFSRLQSSAVNAALATLPGEQKEAIEQAYFRGLSYSQVATRVGAPLGTVKSRIRAGLRRLWDALHGQATT
jgi:RNA polymerase sigma-70 factor (ECF subfamily)